MADLQPDRGLFLSLLDAIDRPGQVVRNVIRGNAGAAGRQAAQLGVDAIDAFLPGDWLPNDIAREEDSVSGGELVGITEPGVAKFLADLGVGTLTDPLTYLTGGASVLAKTAGKAALKFGVPFTKHAVEIPGSVRALELAGEGGRRIGNAAEALLPGTREAVAKAGRGVRSVFGAQRVNPDVAPVLARAKASGSLAAQAGLAATKASLAGLDDRQLTIIGDALDNFRWQDGKLAGELVSTSSDPIRGVQSGTLIDRIRQHPDAVPEEVDALAKAAEDVAGIGRTMRDRPGIFTRASERTAMDAVTGKRTPLMETTGLSDEYLMRQYENLPPEEPLAIIEKAGRTSSSKERTLTDVQKVQEFLARPGNEKVTYQRNALKRLAARSDQQGSMAQRADVGQGIIDLMRAGKIAVPDDLLVDEAMRQGARGAGAAPDVYGISGQSGKAVVGTGDTPDLNLLLGGESTLSANSDPYGTVLGETARAGSTEAADVGRLLGGDASPVDGLSGSSVIGESAPRARLTKADLTPQQIDDATKSILGKDFAYTDKDSRSLVTRTIAEMAKVDPETAQVVANTFGPMAPRGAFTSALAKLNGPFKKFAVMGFAIPKFGSIVRNRIGGAWQTLSNPEARGSAAAMANPVAIGRDMAGAVADSLNLSIGRDRFSSILGDWESALAASGGSEQAAIAALAAKHPEAAEIIAAGVLDGFVRSEDLVKEMRRTPWRKKFANVTDWPARIFRGVEDRMRLGLALDLKAKGSSTGEAVRIARDSLYDYSVASAGNRSARDALPFFQFMAKAIPQQAKFLAEQPSVAVGLSQALGSDDNTPIYPWMENKLSIPIGDDAEGNRQYITGLGLPFEALAQIPNPSSDLSRFGRQIEQSVVGSSQPLLKTLYAAVGGEDPTFQSAYGSYTKVPGLGDLGDAGAAYNQVAGTGLIQPVDSILRTIGKVSDDRRSLPVNLLDSLTGLNVASVDEDRALLQQLQAALERNPDIRSFTTPVNVSGDPELDELLAAVRDTRKRIKSKRETRELASVAPP